MQTNSVWSKFKYLGQPPSKRCEHKAVLLSNSMYLFGGYNEKSKLNDLYELDLISHEWKKLTPKGDIPSIRSGHSAVVWRDSLLIFGGHDGGETENFLYEYNFKNNCWSRVQCNGTIPSSRNNHTAVVSGDKMILFGGYDGKRRNDLHIFDCIQKKWFQVKHKGKVPSERSSHSAVLYNGNMYIFGGVNEENQRCNDLYKFEIQTETWNFMNYFGDAPRRSCHTAVVHNKCMYIFAGFDGEENKNDFYQFNFETKQWKELIADNVPCNRAYHSAVVFNDSMIIFGGFVGSYCEEYLNDIYEYRFDIEQPVHELNTLIDCKQFSDVRIHVEHATFYAHKCIICQSSVLNKLITSTKSEGNIVEIRLQDIKLKIFEKLFVYLYSGNIEVANVDELPELIYAANQYQLEDMHHKCMLYFNDLVNHDNVLTVLMKSHKLRLPLLKTLCLNYIYINYSQVIYQHQLNQLDKTLMMEILQFKQLQPVKNKKGNTLKHHISMLWKTQKFSDICLISADGKRFKAHRAILGVYSQFFKTMLITGFKESFQNEIYLDNIDHYTLELILKYIYTNSVSFPEDFTVLMNVLHFSDLYMLDKLHEICKRKIIDQITPNNAINMLKICHEFNIEGDVKEKCWAEIKNSNREALIDQLIQNKLQLQNKLLDQQKENEKYKQRIRELEEKIFSLEQNQKKLEQVIKEQKLQIEQQKFPQAINNSKFKD